jgi:hypothetical protein
LRHPAARPIEESVVGLAGFSGLQPTLLVKAGGAPVIRQ